MRQARNVMSLKFRKFLVIFTVLLLEVAFALCTLYLPGKIKLLFLVFMVLNTVFVNKTVVFLRKLFKIPEDINSKY